MRCRFARRSRNRRGRGQQRAQRCGPWPGGSASASDEGQEFGTLAALAMALREQRLGQRLRQGDGRLGCARATPIELPSEQPMNPSMVTRPPSRSIRLQYSARCPSRGNPRGGPEPRPQRREGHARCRARKQGPAPRCPSSRRVRSRGDRWRRRCRGSARIGIDRRPCESTSIGLLAVDARRHRVRRAAGACGFVAG
jgi:hypothetical protein